MAIYQYDQPQGSPLVGTIADLIQRGGLIRAQAATQVADANAWASAQKANIWGNTISNLSQIPGQIMAQRSADQQAATRNAVLGLQGMKLQSEMQEEQRKLSDKRMSDAAVRELAPQFTKTDPVTGTTSMDLEGLTGALRKKGVPEDYISGWTDQYQKAETARSQFAASQRANRQQTFDALAEVAAGSSDISGYLSGLQAKVDAGLLDPKVAQNAQGLLGTYQGDFDAFKKDQIGTSMAVKEHLAKLAKEDAEAAAARANAAKLSREALEGKQGTPEEEYYKAITTGDTAKAQTILKALQDTANAKRDPVQQAFVREMAGLRVDQAKAKLKELQDEKVKEQDKLEQQYRTGLRTSMSSRSGTVGTEDAKVGQANHLLGLISQSYDPETGNYNITTPQYSELALGLARLLSPSGTVGIQLQKEFEQATAFGDITKKLSYYLGTPLTGTTQDVINSLRDSIERQGVIATENRKRSLDYLRKTVRPTRLDQERASQIEAAEMNPLRMTRVVRDKATGKLRTRVSHDGKTWDWEED